MAMDEMLTLLETDFEGAEDKRMIPGVSESSIRGYRH